MLAKFMDMKHRIRIGTEAIDPLHRSTVWGDKYGTGSASDRVRGIEAWL
jgi:hypothetical protein